MTFISYAQNYEDVMLWRALGQVSNGFYVDVGANDPVSESVTNAFYQRGWTGINIEPVKQFYDRLCKMRPNDTNLPVCAGNIDGDLLFYEISENGLSTTEKAIADLERRDGWQVVERTSQVLTLNTILEKYSGDHPIHFLKIDVEGGEQSVLEGLDLSYWRPWIIVIEATIPFSTELNCAAWEEILDNANYELAYFDGLNRFYVAKEKSEIINQLRVPPNFFDNYITDDFHYLTIERDAIRAERDAIRAERDALKLVIDDIYHSNSWRITAPLRYIANARHSLLSKVRPLFPLRTLPKRLALKLIHILSIRIIIPLSENRIAKTIANRFPKVKGRLRRLVYGQQQTPTHFSPTEHSTPMSPPVIKVYLDLLNSIKKHSR